MKLRVGAIIPGHRNGEEEFEVTFTARINKKQMMKVIDKIKTQEVEVELK